MKLNDPVSCRQLFKDHLEQGEEGLWCVSLRPNGRILELFEIPSYPETPCRTGLPTNSSYSENKQWLFVRIAPDQPLYDEWDWLWIDQINNWSQMTNCNFCDYLKLSEKSHSSLLKYQH